MEVWKMLQQFKQQFSINLQSVVTVPLTVIATTGFCFVGLEPANADSRAPSFITTPQISPNPNPTVPLGAVLKFATDEPVTATIVLSDGTHTWELHFDPEDDPSQGLPIIGMRPDRQHTIAIEVQDQAGNTTEFPDLLTFQTPPLPQDPGEFPPLDVRTSSPELMEPGITVLSVRRNKAAQGKPEVQKFNQGWGMLLAIDATGEPLWYYRNDSRINDFEVLQNGNIVYISQDYRAIEIDWLGNVVNSWWATGRPEGPADDGIPIQTDTLHHDIDELPNGDLAVLGTQQRTIANYYTSEDDPNAPRADQQVMGDLIIEFQRDGKLVWQWNTFEYLDPFRIGYETFKGFWNRRGFPNTVDWSHANNLVYDERDDSFLLCLRYQAAILKIDRSTGDIIWILGEPSGWPLALQDKLFTLEGENARWFYHQHSPEPTPNGTVLIFDNANYQARPFTPPLLPIETYSRAVEYRLNEDDRIAQQVWSSEIPGEQKVVSFAMGDVDALPQTDNILLSEGFLLPNDKLPQLTWDNILSVGGWTRIRELTHTEPPEVLWEVVMDNGSDPDAIGWHIFSSERMALPFSQ
jgi:hypothetical protein